MAQDDLAQGGSGLIKPHPPLPATTPEYINTIAHYYRGEIARMSGWRDRIDRTSNWAITVVAAMLSVSLSSPTAHHGVLLFAMLLVLLMLSIEARRYRFFDVYRARVRRLARRACPNCRLMAPTRRGFFAMGKRTSMPLAMTMMIWPSEWKARRAVSAKVFMPFLEDEGFVCFGQLLGAGEFLDAEAVRLAQLHEIGNVEDGFTAAVAHVDVNG